MNAKIKYYALSLLFTVLSITQLWAYDFNAVSPSGHRLYYTITSNTAPRTVEVVSPTGSGYSGYTEPTGNVIVPETVTYLGNTYRVAKLADRAFYRCTQILTLSLPTSLKYIGDYACYNNGALTSIVIPDSVTFIGNGAFQYNFAMTSVTLSSQLQSIGNHAFMQTPLTSIVIPNNTEIIGSSAFDGCNNLQSVVIGNSVTTISTRAFNSCYNLQSISIPNSVESIENQAFIYCNSLSTIDIGDDVSHIGDEAFIGTAYYNNVANWINNVLYIDNHLIKANASISGNYDIPNRVRCIADAAFKNCENITSITFPNTLKTIGNYAFHKCFSLTDISFPNSLVSIGSNAFEECTSLTSVVLENSLKNIGNYTFKNCNLLQTVYWNKNLSSFNNNVFSGCNNIQTLTIGDSVRFVPNNFMDGRSSLRTVSFGANIDTIGDYAFRGCSGLTSVDFPQSVRVIGSNAFENCDNLLSVEIPSSINSIGGYAFNGCDTLSTILWNTNVLSFNNVFSGCNNVQSVTIGDSVRFVPNNFMDGRSSLHTVTFGANIDTIGNYAFRGCSGLSSVTILPSIRHIGSNAFENCDKLTSVEIPYTVNNMGASVFKNCDSLRTVVWNTNAFISHHRNNSGNRPFEGCISLEQFIFGDSVRRICDYALYGWGYNGNQDNYFRNLKTVIIGDNVDTIGIYAFDSNYKLDSVRWGGSLTTIGNYAFHSAGLKNLIIPSSVKTINRSAFENCDSLLSIEIPSSVTTIGEYVFNMCDTLTTILWNTNVVSYNNNVFRECNNIQTLTTGDSVRFVPNYFMDGRSSLRTVSFGANIDTIGDYAFRGCSGLTSIVFPESVSAIGNYAFENCDKLLSVEIPSSINSIGGYAFKNCDSLRTVMWNTNAFISHQSNNSGNKPFEGCISLELFVFGDSVRRIYDHALGWGYYGNQNNYFRNLKTVIIGNNIDTIGTSAFESNHNLDSVRWGNSVTTIGDYAFHSTGLENLTIPSTVTTVASRAFENCDSLLSIEIPSTVTTIGGYVFYHCDSLRTVVWNTNAVADNPFNNCLNIQTLTFGDSVLKVQNNFMDGRSSLRAVSFGANVDTIGNYAFRGCSGLTAVVFPESVSVIGNNAFENCDNLLSVEIPSSINSIGGYAFNGCDSLATILWNTNVLSFNNVFSGCNNVQTLTIGDSVRFVPNNFMDGRSSLRAVSFGANVDTIGNSAFYNCNSLTSVDLSNVETIGNNAFYNCSGLISVDFGNVETIGNNAFYNCSGLTSVDLSNVETMGHSVFWSCSGLTSVDLSNVETIGSYAFRGCSGLTSVVFPESVSVIGNNAFENCDKLLSVEIPSSINSIGGNAFKNCDSLTTILWNANISSSNNNIFSECSNVQTLTIGDSTRVVPNSFMDGCSSLRIVSFGANVDTIGNNAFKNCDNLLSVEIPHYIKHVGTNAFYSCDSLKTVVWNTPYAELNHDIYNNKPFEACDSLTTFIFGDSIRIIPFRAIGGGSLPRAPINVRKVVIGKNIDTIYNETFNVCSNLDTIVSYAQIPPIIPNPSSAWGNTPTETLILVPCGSGNAYRSSSGWNRFTNISDWMANNEIILSVNNEDYGSIEYDCPTGSLIATPIYGYRFEHWNDGDTNNPRLFVVTQDTAFEAIFEVRLPCNFAITSGNAVRGSAIGSGTYLQDTVVTISAEPNYGYHFTQWSDGDTNNPRSIMVMSDTTLTAIFDKNTYTVAAISANTALGTVVGGGSFEYLDTITITATAMPGYEFYSWDDGDTNSIRRVVVTESKTYTATFGLPAFYLVVNANDTAMGSVSGGGFYVINSQQQITATANSGYHFVEWSDGNTNRTRSVRMVSDTSFTAIFAKNTYNISITNNTRGVFTGAGQYEYLDTATISVVPNYGYSFAYWNDGDSNATRQVVVTANRTYTATFSTNSYTINVVSNDTTMGTVSGAGTYAYNTNRTITATPTAFEYCLLYWSDGSVANPRTISVLSDTTYYAVFGLKPTYTLTVLSNNNAIGTVAGSDTAIHGTSLEISATATVYGYHFARWSDGSTQNPRTIQMLKDSTITAIFERNTYTLATSVYGGTAYGSVAGGGNHLYLDTVSITATPNYGYHFTSWNDGDTNNPRQVRVMSDTTFTAVFDRNTYSLACSVNVGNRGNVSGAGNYLYRDNVSIAATSYYGYHFTQWSDGNTQNPRMVRIIRDTSFTAIFERNTYSVSGAVNVQDRGSVSGVGNYLYLDSVYVTANANYGYHFTQWSDENTDNPRIIQITKDSTLTAEFDKNTYTVSANANFEDRGTITGAGEYLYKELAQISAAPEYGYNFVRWNDGNTQRSRFLNVLSDTSFTAIFEPIVYRVTVGVASGNTGRGTVVGGGNIAYKDSTTIKAFSLYGYHFYNWSDGNTDSIRTVEVLGNANYYATFAPNKYTVNLSVSDEAMGTIEGNGSYDYLTEVQIRANSKQGYFFSQWSDGNKDNPRTITLKRDTAFTAYFTDTYVGMEEAEELENLAFYPNPTEGTITFNNRDIKKIEVMDAVGRVVAVHENSYIIDLSKLSKGLYTLRITLPQGVTIRKVVRK